MTDISAAILLLRASFICAKRHNPLSTQFGGVVRAYVKAPHACECPCDLCRWEMRRG